MDNGFDFGGLLDDLAERVAEKVRAELGASCNGTATIRPRLLTVEQAAVYLGRTEEAVRHLVGSGKIPKVQGDRRIQIDIRDLDRWIEVNKHASENSS